MLNVLITELTLYTNQVMNILRDRGFNVIIAPSTDPNNLRSLIRHADIMIVALARISRDVIEASEKLRGIIRTGTGFDNVDLNAATEKCIPVVFIPDYASRTVAEFTIALILALAKRLIQGNKYVKTREYVNRVWANRPTDLLGIELEGKILGIIGYGRIGRSVAQKAKALGMRILIYDPYVDREDILREGFEPVDLDTLLKNSDFVSIHCPLTQETKHMINEEKLKLMKPSAYIINTARGSIIDEKALYKALVEKRIAGAAIDVYEIEPPDPKNPLLDLDNVITTPHIAFYTEESMNRLVQAIVENVLILSKGEIPQNLANKEILHKCRRDY